MAIHRSKGKMISRGRTAEIFLWGDDRVLKLFLKDFPAAEATYEAWVTRTAYDAGLPVPAVDEVVSVEGRQGIVFEYINGPILTTAMIARPWKFPEFARSMAELHAKVHSCEVPNLPSRKEELRSKIQGQVSITVIPNRLYLEL